MNKKWTTEENEFIKEHAKTFNDLELMQQLTIYFGKSYTHGATRKQRQRLGIKKYGHRGFSKIVDSQV